MNSYSILADTGYRSDNTLYNEEKRLFYGQEKSVLICNSCQAVSSTKAAFSSFSLPIEKHQNIAEAIGGYFKSEQVERKCDFCKTTATATKKITLEEIPKNIVIQLQRFGSTRRKVMKKIDIHLEIYLRKYVEENKVIEDKAKLYGVIVHKGNTLSNGHYYAFILFGSQWYLVDDMRVKQVTIQSLQNIDGQPYLLFYRTMPRPYIS
ncbi:ubiquitin carboxyl-terminal hydrolase 36/42 [Mytilus galloprovincialis]|uniref:Ubiquitin carboxyl-terminal hydrolase 36/42 n=2 Tax=Mytilus TaxID=6548 RepID=A0A8B6EDD8_MYTGA|nr:ubiquitin carboxyl-terminal hydrolase 36/42 [Mytilus galloprovincialis]